MSNEFDFWPNGDDFESEDSSYRWLVPFGGSRDSREQLKQFLVKDDVDGIMARRFWEGKSYFDPARRQLRVDDKQADLFAYPGLPPRPKDGEGAPLIYLPGSFDLYPADRLTLLKVATDIRNMSLAYLEVECLQACGHSLVYLKNKTPHYPGFEDPALTAAFGVDLQMDRPVVSKRVGKMVVRFFATYWSCLPIGGLYFSEVQRDLSSKHYLCLFSREAQEQLLSNEQASK